MKKKLFIFLAVAIMLVCALALTVSADTIVPSDNNAYGELTTFDEAIGNTKISPNKDDGKIARTVLFDGTNYYTVPTYYILTESTKSTGEMMLMNFSEINTKMSKSFNKNSIIRFEMPSDIDFIANNMETFNGAGSMIEVKLNKGLKFWDNGTPKAFANCKSLVEIDISMVDLCYSNNTYSLFEHCENLVKVTLPDAYVKDGTPINYSTNYMFNGCTKLTTIENADNFFAGTTGANEKMFMNCKALTELPLWNGLTTFGSNACSGCTAIEKVIFPDSVTTIGTTSTVFASCTSLKKIVLPKGPVSLGSYCFEKCTALTDVWMPTEASTFAAEVFGQCGSGLAVNFYFATETNVITVSNTKNNKDPYITAINTENDARLKFSTPLSTKCTVFIGGHTSPDVSNDCTKDTSCTVCATIMVEAYDAHDSSVIIAYENGFASVGIKSTLCSREGCTVTNATVDAPAIFTAKGYSYKEETVSGLSGGFTINTDALSEYKSANPDADMTVNIIMLNPKYLDANGAFIDESGVLTVKDGALQVELDKLEYSSFDYMIKGFDLDLMQNLELVIAMVVFDEDGVQIIQKQYAEDEVSLVKNTYTDKNNLKLYSVTVESIVPDMVAALKEQQTA